MVAEDLNELYGLWMHENLRVFHDRMVNNEDKDYFRELIDATREGKARRGAGTRMSPVPEGEAPPPEEADPVEYKLGTAAARGSQHHLWRLT